MADPIPDSPADSYLRHEAMAVGAVVGEIILRRYAIRKLLGIGAMGHVIAVRDIKSGEDAAIKCVPPQLATSDAHMRAIRANYELVHGLRHPHIAALNSLERDPDNGQHYLVMELVRGCDMSEWLITQRARKINIPIELVVGIAEQIAMALDYAHSCPVDDRSGQGAKKFGILHRDLKPANVMVLTGMEYRPGIPFVKLVDFGLAAQIQASLHSISLKTLNKLAGTPVYMAPEQWEGRTLTRGVDQWALAVMIYELAAGQRPFDGSTENEVMLNVKAANPVKPPAFSDAQWNALRVAFNVDRKKRYRSCIAMVKALAEADQRTTDTLIAAEITMPDEFAGWAAAAHEAENRAANDSPQSVANGSKSGSIVKWLVAAILLLLLSAGSYFGLVWYAKLREKAKVVHDDKNDDNQNTAIILPDIVDPINTAADGQFPSTPTELAHKTLTAAMEQITDPKKKRSWARIQTLLEEPVQNPLNATHPSIAVAKKLLNRAKEELVKAPEFERKLELAKRQLKEGHYEESLANYEAARTQWPDSGRFDEIFQDMKQARQSIQAQRIEQNKKVLDDLWEKYKDAAPNGPQKWDEIVTALEPALELEGNGNLPEFAAAQKLLKTAKAEAAFQKQMKKAGSFLETGRLDDAQTLYGELLTQTQDADKRKQLETAVRAVQTRMAEVKSAVAKEAEKN